MERNKNVCNSFNKLPTSLHNRTKRFKCFEALYKTNHIECKNFNCESAKKLKESPNQVINQCRNGSSPIHVPHSAHPYHLTASGNSRRQMYPAKTTLITDFQQTGNIYYGKIELSITTTFFQIVISVLYKKNSDVKIHLRNNVQLCRLLLVLTNNQDIFLCPTDASTILIWSSMATLENRLKKLAEQLYQETNCFFKIKHSSIQIATKDIPNTFLARALFLWFACVALDNNWIYTGDWLSILSSEPTICLIDASCLSSCNKSLFGAICITLKEVFLVTSPNSPETAIATLSVQAILATMHISRFTPKNENLLPCTGNISIQGGIARAIKKTSDYLNCDMEKSLITYWRRQHGFNIPEYSHVVQVAFGSKTFCYPINVLWKERWVFQPFSSLKDTKLLATFIGMTLKCRISLVPQPKKYSILQTFVVPTMFQNTNKQQPHSQETPSHTFNVLEKTCSPSIHFSTKPSFPLESS